MGKTKKKKNSGSGSQRGSPSPATPQAATPAPAVSSGSSIGSVSPSLVKTLSAAANSASLPLASVAKELKEPKESLEQKQGRSRKKPSTLADFDTGSVDDEGSSKAARNGRAAAK